MQLSKRIQVMVKILVYLPKRPFIFFFSFSYFDSCVCYICVDFTLSLSSSFMFPFMFIMLPKIIDEPIVLP